MDKLRLLELFGGIGACSSALTRLGIEYEIVDYVEIDKYAVKSYNAIHGTDFKPQDIANTILTTAGQRVSDNFIITPHIYTYYDENTELNVYRQKQECIDTGYSEESIKRIRNNIIKGDIINTLTANAMQSVNHNNCALIKENNSTLQIRKLTPKECWRLMGFTDEEFEKASQVNSNTQLYKQAGNSIVVNILVNILNNLLKGD